MIDITHLDLIDFVKNVYNLTKPGKPSFLYSSLEPLTDGEALVIIKERDIRRGRITDGILFSMERVKQRKCNMTAIRHEGRILIPDTWGDHSLEDLEKLLEITKRRKGVYY